MSQGIFVDILVNSLALWQEFCMNSFMDIKKSYHHHLGFELEHPYLLGLGDNMFFHSRPCCLVIGLYSSLVATFFSQLDCSKMSSYAYKYHSFALHSWYHFAEMFLIHTAFLIIFHTPLLFCSGHLLSF